MRLHEISPPPSHPHVAAISIDPADWPRIQRMIEDARELRFLDLDDSLPNAWDVRIGCASERVRECVEENWG